MVMVTVAILAVLALAQAVAARNAHQQAKSVVALSDCLREFHNLAKERDDLLQARIEELERTSLHGNKSN